MAKSPIKRSDHLEICPDLERQPVSKDLILFEDDCLMVIHKPAGWLADGKGAIDAALTSHLQLDRPLLPAHRLDVETSGCLLLGKNPETRELLFSDFKTRNVKKSYQALVYGRLPLKKATCKKNIDGKTAETHFNQLMSIGDYSLIEACPITGRTHQIRRHLNSMGCPVLGDKYYGPSFAIPKKLRAIARHLLHAQRIRFRHPIMSQWVDVAAPLPRDFEKWKKHLGF